MPRPPHGADLAPSDNHFFRELKQHIGEKELASDDAIKTHAAECFKSKPENFYASGVENLSIRWKSVVDAEGECIVD